MAIGRDPRVLLFECGRGRAEPMRSLLAERGLPAHVFGIHHKAVDELLPGADIAAFIVEPTEALDHVERLHRLLEQLREHAVATLVWPGSLSLPSMPGSALQFFPADARLEEVAGRVTAMAQYVPVVKRLDSELAHLQRLGRQVSRFFSEMDKEMRLAGRLQRDFMPRELPSLSPFQFAHLYRPATWVSGDIYDVLPVAAGHAGVFLADAMGHGTAAGLMTMFLRKALVTSLTDGAPTPPAQTLQQLHDGLARHDLPNSNFVTATYVLADRRTREVQIARGGHPYCLWIRAGGEIREVRCEGGLLGIAEISPEFEEVTLTMEPGDKLVCYTDGLEDAFIADRPANHAEPAQFTRSLQSWAPLPAKAFVAAVTDFLDHREGSLNPDDDVTLLVMEVEPPVG